MRTPNESQRPPRSPTAGRFPRMGAIAAVLVAASIWAPGARATVMVEVAIEDMIAEADAIVLARVIGNGGQVHLVANGLEPHTVTRLRVSRWLKGNPASAPATGDGDSPTTAALGSHPFGEPEVVRIRELGGELPGGGAIIDGTPQYRLGEEVLVFLRRDQEMPGAYHTYGMAQGKFTVMRGVPGQATTVQRDLGHLSFAQWRNGTMEVAAAANGGAMDLDAFIAFIAAVLDQQGPTASPPGALAPTPPRSGDGALGGRRDDGVTGRQR